MSAIQKRSFSLPAEEAEYIDKLVASGAYASSSEVVRAGLRALQDQDDAIDESDDVIERWLREEVVPTIEAFEADPSQGIPAEDVFAELRAMHEERVKARRGS